MLNEEKKHKLIVFFTIFLILFCFFSGCVDLKCAYIKTSIVKDGWNENTALRNTGIQFLGLEKWCSVTYEIKGKYPASITITTLKSLVLADEKEVMDNSKKTIEDTFEDNIELRDNITGERILNNNHKTKYIIYNGFDINKEESVKVICEIWNCADSGTTIICIGIAYTTNKEITDEFYIINWQKIVQDLKGSIDGIIGNEGLIDNVICH